MQKKIVAIFFSTIAWYPPIRAYIPGSASEAGFNLETQKPLKQTFPLRFWGQDRASKKPCALLIHDLRETARGIEAIVSTEYRHGNESPGIFTLLPNNANSLRGLSEEDGKSELVLFFTHQPNKELVGLSHYHLRWWHINHHHNHACMNLVNQP